MYSFIFFFFLHSFVLPFLVAPYFNPWFFFSFFLSFLPSFSQLAPFFNFSLLFFIFLFSQFFNVSLFICFINFSQFFSVYSVFLSFSPCFSIFLSFFLFFSVFLLLDSRPSCVSRSVSTLCARRSEGGQKEEERRRGGGGGGEVERWREGEGEWAPLRLRSLVKAAHLHDTLLQQLTPGPQSRSGLYSFARACERVCECACVGARGGRTFSAVQDDAARIQTLVQKIPSGVARVSLAGDLSSAALLSQNLRRNPRDILHEQSPAGGVLWEHGWPKHCSSGCCNRSWDPAAAPAELRHAGRNQTRGPSAAHGPGCSWSHAG